MLVFFSCCNPAESWETRHKALPFPWVILWVLKYCTGAEGECLPPLCYLWVRESCWVFYLFLLVVFFFPSDTFFDIGEQLEPGSLISLSFQCFYPLTSVQVFWIYLHIKENTFWLFKLQKGLKKKKPKSKFLVLSRVVLQMSETLCYDSLS